MKTETVIRGTMPICLTIRGGAAGDLRLDLIGEVEIRTATSVAGSRLLPRNITRARVDPGLLPEDFRTIKEWVGRGESLTRRDSL